ncbi:outer membrane beta-barrel protein [Gallaecimonas sp. GXIMD4217]|uniref:outer membrane beta-barrel protein n=1 Tax=Gallaecimonas sp. GXIMD4217 TaxID=3131927 RepID=UPI00311AC1E1
MRRTSYCLGICCACLPLFSQSESFQPLNASILPTFVGADKDRQTDEHGFGLRAFYGWKLKGNWQYEAQLFHLVLETDTPAMTDFYQTGLGLDARYNFDSDGGMTPYLSFGLGAVYNDVIPDARDETSAFLNGAAGLVSRELGPSKIRIRTEFRVFYDTFNDNYLDWQFGLGFEFPLE